MSGSCRGGSLSWDDVGLRVGARALAWDAVAAATVCIGQTGAPLFRLTHRDGHRLTLSLAGLGAEARPLLDALTRRLAPQLAEPTRRIEGPGLALDDGAVRGALGTIAALLAVLAVVLAGLATARSAWPLLLVALLPASLAVLLWFAARRLTGATIINGQGVGRRDGRDDFLVPWSEIEQVALRRYVSSRRQLERLCLRGGGRQVELQAGQPEYLAVVAYAIGRAAQAEVLDETQAAAEPLWAVLLEAAIEAGAERRAEVAGSRV